MISLDNVNIEEAVGKLRDDLAVNGIYKLTDIKTLQNNVLVTCPVHKDGHERKPSCGIRTTTEGKHTKGTVHCFTCGLSVYFDEFVSICFGYDDGGDFGRKWLHENFDINEVFTRNQVIHEDNITTKNVNYDDYEDVLDKYRFIHPYMYHRKLNDEMIELFDVGYDSSTNEITFPVRDETGHLCFVARRSIIGKVWRYPEDVLKPVYALDLIRKLKIKEVVVCESFINAIYSWQLGRPAIALMGTGSDYQYNILQQSGIRHYILGFDGDDAGNKGKREFCKRLKNYAYITQYILPVGKDINDLSPQEYLNLIEYSI